MNTNLSKEKIFNENTQLKLKLNELENELKLSEEKLKEQYDMSKKEHEECIQKLNDQQIKSDLKIESLKCQNLTLKNEIISLRSAKKDLDLKITELNELVNKQNEESKKLSTTISKWSDMYKCLAEKSKKIEELEVKIRQEIKAVVDVNKSLVIMNMHSKCLIEVSQEENKKSLEKLNDKIFSKENELDELNKKYSDSEFNNALLVKKIAEVQDHLDKVKLEMDLVNKKNQSLEEELVKSNQLAASNSNQLIEQKSANLNLEALLKEKTNMIQKIKEERNALSLELNENIIKYDIQIEELKNEIKRYEFKLKKECNERELLEQENSSLQEKLMNQAHLNELNNKTNKLVYDNCTQTITSSKPKQVFTQTIPINVKNAESQTDANCDFGNKHLRGNSNNRNLDLPVCSDDSDDLPEIDIASMTASIKTRLNDSVAYKNKNVQYKNNSNLEKFIPRSELFKNTGLKSKMPLNGNETDRIEESHEENLKSKKVRFSSIKFMDKKF